VKEAPRSIINCFNNPSNCFNIKGRGNVVSKIVSGNLVPTTYEDNTNCGDLKRGDKCEVEWRVEIKEDAQVGSEIPVDVDFVYDSSMSGAQRTVGRLSSLGVIDSDTINVIASSPSTSLQSMTTGAIRAITGNVVQEQTVGRFKCALKNEPTSCCYAPFFRISNHGDGCVFDEEAFGLLEEEDFGELEALKDEIFEKMAEFLKTNDLELVSEIQALEDRLLQFSY
jgi:hypothetical protein